MLSDPKKHDEGECARFTAISCPSIEIVEHVIVRLILTSSRNFVALSLAVLCAVVSCRNLIGLDGYSVADDGAGNGAGNGNGAGTGNSGGSSVEGGDAGVEPGEGGTSGAPDDNGGAAGASGSSESGGSSGTSGSGGQSGSAGTSGSAGSSGSAGGGGGPAVCPGGCDDSNDCTTDSCVLGSCAHDALPLDTACGVARTCDAQSYCVRCRDTAAGLAQDFGCSPSAPVCVGTGLDAVCGGCTVAADCNDGNECTTETCSAGKCVFATVAAGSACTAGVCNGTASMEKCVACADTAAGATQDAGCTSAKRVCDPSGTPTCYECLSGADCASDSVSCTVETCTNHVCSHVATDSQCAASTDVCKPNKCDAAQGCKQVDISAQTTLIDADTVGNGSFELGTEPATGWNEDGKYWITRDCGTTTGCTPGSNNGKIKASAGRALAWMGGVNDAGIGDLSKTLLLPAGARSLRIRADLNFQTVNKTVMNRDYFELRLMDAAYVQIGSPLLSLSNTDAVTGSTHPWTFDGVDKTVDVSAYAGKVVTISFWTSCDTAYITDFYLDNVRVTATVCQ